MGNILTNVGRRTVEGAQLIHNEVNNNIAATQINLFKNVLCVNFGLPSRPWRFKERSLLADGVSHPLNK